MRLSTQLAIFCLFLALPLFASNPQGDTVVVSKSIKLQIGGFLRTDFVYDTRKTAEVVDGLVSFYPMDKLPDANGRDLNKASSTALSAIATRMTFRFFGPEVLNAKSSAYVEFDFTGMSNTYGIRLRQVYSLLDWGETSLLMGRTWMPLSIASMPNVVAFNTGAPFWNFNRSDQLRFSWMPGNFLLSATAAMQGDYCTLGPDPAGIQPALKSNMFMRDAMIPEIDLWIQYKYKNWLFGAIGHTKSVQPRTVTTGEGGLKYKTNQLLTTFTAMGYLQYKDPDFTMKASSMYAQNMTESLMLGGYAVSNVDPVTGAEEYTPIQHWNSWINLDYGKVWQAGFFAGYIRNLGTLDREISTVYARAGNIRSMWRFSPHLFFNAKNLQLGSELEISGAEFGTIDKIDYGKVAETHSVTNLRLNLLMMFLF